MESSRLGSSVSPFGLHFTAGEGGRAGGREGPPLSPCSPPSFSRSKVKDLIYNRCLEYGILQHRALNSAHLNTFSPMNISRKLISAGKGKAQVSQHIIIHGNPVGK